MAAEMTLSKMMQRAINHFWTLRIPGTQKIIVESVHLFGTNIRSGTWTTKDEGVQAVKMGSRDLDL